jgi:predicted RNase H-like nuclease
METCGSDEEILEFVHGHLTALTVVMIDAPLVIPNRTGMRSCDRSIQVEFGRYEAGCYPANQVNMGRYTGGIPRAERLGRLLVRLGFSWPPGGLPPTPVARGLWLFECYPHPAHIRLFGLTKTIKYKKKRQSWPVARREFRRYLDLVSGLRQPRILRAAAIRRALDVSDQVGRGYKAREDMLDALFCAYLAALVPEGRLGMVGRPEEGSIVVPAPLVDQGARSTALQPRAPRM